MHIPHVMGHVAWAPLLHSFARRSADRVASHLHVRGLFMVLRNLASDDSVHDAAVVLGCRRRRLGSAALSL